MKFKGIYLLAALLVASLLIASCGSKTDGTKGSETTSGTSVAPNQQTPATAAVPGAPDAASVDTLNKDLTATSSDLDSIKVGVDANTFQ